ncbi:DUF934 domain-containing protein [Lentibacter algarum]|uniref:DUF934 domain-containing protein n=1 Tax=Lentibacter algarum TaxID=576131 RepID=UPI001C07804E|nr:DUF934 domain-containing protein [Lentibacter algarum]MBU2981712.1 DUF934 domain-containing protein [Lentibacter algarum]
MITLVRDDGFHREDWPHGFTENRREISGENGSGLDLDASADPAELQGRLLNVGMIRVRFDSFADGRVFTIARQLRLMGYTGRLRVAGPLLADQYAMARRVGFDEAEISAEHAERQPEASWIFRADWQNNNYQARLRG